MDAINLDIRRISQVVEKISKRLRKVEVLPRLSGDFTADTFLELTDSPDVYAGYAGWAVFVNNNEDAVEFQPVGSACVTFICGPIGWRGYGGATVRTLVHEAAFQLTADGDDRGANAIDLQIDQPNDTYVAAALASAILTNEENKIEDDCEYSVIAGTWNEVRDNSANNFIYGWSCDIFADSFGNQALGGSHWMDDSNYCTLVGYNNNTDGAFGCFIFGELNEAIQTADAYPTYCGQGGILNSIEGDIFVCFQFGESNKMYASGAVGARQIWQSAQFGYLHYAKNVGCNYQFGQQTKSHITDADAGNGYYRGRILLSADPGNDTPTDGTGEVGGFNQGSWFSQTDLITTWNVAWTTGRFQFPIIQDSIWAFLIYIGATERGCANSHMWKIEGVIENDGGVTTMLASTVTNVYRDVATKECQVVADDPNDRLAVQFRDTAGPDATWTNIQVSMLTVEVGAEV